MSNNKTPEIFKIVAEEVTTPARKRYPTRKVIVHKPNDIFSMDLCDMNEIIDENDGIRYMLTCVDCFSRHAWAIPLKNKTGKTVLEGIKEIIKQNHNIYPNKLWVDQGSEFYNQYVKKYLKEHNIEMYSVYGVSKAAMVERFNRTLKTMMWRVFIANNSHRWLDILPELLEIYNNRKHSSTKQTPIMVHKDTEEINREVNEYEYGDLPTSNTKPAKFKIGDYVRISRQKEIFEKGYHPSFSMEIYRVTKVLQTVPWTYRIEDLNKEDIIGSFYTEELLKTKQNPDSEFLIEKVIKTRTYKGQKQELVKYLGYSDKFNEWINI